MLNSKSKSPISTEVNNNKKKVITADRLGNTRIPVAVLDSLVHPEGALTHKIPHEDDEETILSKVESLIGKGHYGAAIKAVKLHKISQSPLTSQYEFLMQEKLSRAYIGIADSYIIRGNKEDAKRFLSNTIKPETTNQHILQVSQIADEVFEHMTRQRQKLFEDIVNVVKDSSYADWCNKRKFIKENTIFDNQDIRESVFADFSLESKFGNTSPINPTPGWIDTTPPEIEQVDTVQPTIPASVFKFNTTKSVSVDVDILSTDNSTGKTRIRASVAMPIIANVLAAKLRIYAMDRDLNLSGQTKGQLPVFRYEYLRDKAREIIKSIQDIESRMLPIQFELDDFAEITGVVRQNILEQEAEIEAVKQKINELTQTLTALAEVEKEMEKVVLLLVTAQGECECGWWCWAATIIGVVVLGGFAIVISAALACIDPSLVIPFLQIAVPLILAEIDRTREINCTYVDEIEDQASSALNGIRKSIQETEAELNYQLSVRDILAVNITIFSNELNELNQSNQHRLLNATTLNTIQAQYNTIRQSLLTRAHSISKLAEDAFNFEYDSDIKIVKYHSYYDEEKKGYTAVESLLRDLDGLDYIDITGRAQHKTIQLSHTVSLRKDYPISFPSILFAGKARFMTTMKDFDYWFPGTYMQRIKEVRVEVVVGEDNKVVPARGYISNDGVSYIRFLDSVDRFPMDNKDVYVEPDKDIAGLCFKRFERRRHKDTMAFPDFDSFLYEDRILNVQNRERNYFENIGPESSWVIEILPDQSFAFSKIVDVKVHFQYEAHYDENLKWVLQQKRHKNRLESAILSFSKIAKSENKAANFSDIVVINVLKTMFEAPLIDKKINNAGFALKLKDGVQFNGVTKLEVSFEGSTPYIVLETNNEGIVATAPDHPAGSGLANLEALIQNKNVEGKWAVKVVDLPPSINTDDIEDVLLLLNYEYSTHT